MSAELEQAIADLRAIGARFSPEARLGSALADPMFMPPDPVTPSAQVATATGHAPMQMDPDYVGNPDTAPNEFGVPSRVPSPLPGMPAIPDPALIPTGAGAGPSVNQVSEGLGPMMTPPIAGGRPAPRPDTIPQLSPAMQQGMAEAQAEPQDPYALGAPGAPLPAPTSVADAEAQRNAAVDQRSGAQLRAVDAQMAADKDVATQKYNALTAYNDQMAKADIERERDTQAMNAKDDMEMANWVQSMADTAKKEPNPHRYWENSSGLSKVLWVLGNLAGAAYAATTPGGVNTAAKMFQQEVDRDVALQEARLKREMAIGELKGKVMEKTQTRNRSDLMAKYDRKYLRYTAAERALEAKADIPGDMQAAAKKAAAMSIIQQSKVDLAQDKLTAMRQQSAAAIQMAHADKLQQAQFSHAKEMADIQFQHAQTLQKQAEDAAYRKALDTSPVSLGSSLGLGGSGRNPIDPKTGEPTYREVQSGPGTGVVFKDKKGGLANGDGRIMFRKEDGKEAGEFSGIVTDANEHYTAMKDLLDELEHGQSGYRYAIHGVADAKLQGLISKVGMTIAKQQNGGRPTDKDFSVAVSQAIGFDPNGKWLDRAKFATNMDDVKQKIRDDLSSYPSHVTNALRNVPQEINGQGEAVWDPKYLTMIKPAPRTEAEILGKTPAAVPIRGTYTGDKYRAEQGRQFEDSSYRGLPAHDESTIDSILAMSKSTGEDGKVTTSLRSPKAIEAEVERILAPVEERINELKAKIGDPKDPWNQGEQLTKDEAAELLRLNNTKVIANDIAADTADQARQALTDFDGWLAGQPVIAPGSGRAEARKRYGLRAPEDVDALVFKHNREAEKRGPVSNVRK